MRVAGVPEHFNIPVRRVQGTTEFIPVHGGSGAMLEGLVRNEFDVIIALTESVVAAMEKGVKIRVLGTYVASSLRWGISVRPGMGTIVDDLNGKRFGISRWGSGSHLMAQVLAAKQGWTSPLEFVVCDDFATLRRKLCQGEIDAFLWEWFMTKPFDDAGEVHLIGHVPTPWPCFVFAAREQQPPESVERLKHWMSAVLKEAGIFQGGQGGESVSEISRQFGIKPDDAKDWLAQVQYASEVGISRQILLDLRQTLVRVGILEDLHVSVNDYVLHPSLLLS